MSGDYFDQDKIDRFGQPWHGILRNGEVTLPNGLVRPLAGAAVQGFDCFAVKIPNQPPVTTSPADEALGMHWLNYAIVSGSNHVFYGRALGAMAWIYIDDVDATPWKAVASITAAGAATITLSRLDDLTVTQTLSAMVDPAPVFSVTGYDVLFEDVATHGRAAVFAWERAVTVPPHAPKTPRYAKCYAELVLSGAPPMASATCTMIVEKAAGTTVYAGTDDIADVRYDVIDQYDAETNVLIYHHHSSNIEQAEVVGVMYDAQNVRQFVKRHLRNEMRDYTKTRTPNTEWGYLFDGTETDKRWLQIGSTQSPVISASFSYTGETNTPVLLGEWSAWGDLADRYNNKCYGLHEISTGGLYRYSAFASFGAAALRSDVVPSTANPPSAVVDPLTGEIILLSETAVRV